MRRVSKVAKFCLRGVCTYRKLRKSACVCKASMFCGLSPLFHERIKINIKARQEQLPSGLIL